MKYASIADYDYTKQPTEQTGLVSLTIPDQALTPRQVMDRYLRGQPLPQMEDMGYSPLNLSEFDHMDKFDKITAARKLKERINEFKQNATTQAEKEAAEKAEKEYNEKLENAVNERLAKKDIDKA